MVVARQAGNYQRASARDQSIEWVGQRGHLISRCASKSQVSLPTTLTFLSSSSSRPGSIVFGDEQQRRRHKFSGARPPQVATLDRELDTGVVGAWICVLTGDGFEFWLPRFRAASRLKKARHRGQLAHTFWHFICGHHLFSRPPCAQLPRASVSFPRNLGSHCA